MNNEAKELLKAIDNYMRASCKKDYKFTNEENITIQRQLKILDNHINMLIKYEITREGK